MVRKHKYENIIDVSLEPKLYEGWARQYLALWKEKGLESAEALIKAFTLEQRKLLKDSLIKELKKL